MDSKEQKTDAEPKAESLETNEDSLETTSGASNEAVGTTKDGDKTITDTRDKATAASEDAANAAKKTSFIANFWRRFNIYLLLFLLTLVIAIGVTVILFLKDRSVAIKNKESIDVQTLSQDSQKQLSNTSVNIGTSSQVLNVASNSIFAGNVLIRSNLEVAGGMKVGGDLQLPGITVSGSSKFGQLQTNDLVAGTGIFQGPLIARKGLSINGNATVDGALSASSLSANTLTLNGDLNLTHHITAGGPTPGISRGTALGAGGTVSLGGSDTSGSVTINTGGGPNAGCFANVTFTQRFNGTPHVVISPVGSGAAGLNYYVNRSTTEFSICTTNPAPGNQTFGFDYMIFD